MKTALNFLRALTVISLFSVLGWSQTQPAPTPVVPPRAPGSAPHPGVDPSKMAPTGLAANGGAIANDVYTNTLYGFSMKVPPGWVVVPSKSPMAPNPNAKEAALLQQTAQVNRVLLVMTENAPMKKSVQRKSIQIVATRLLKKPGPNEGQDYLFYSKRTAMERGMPVEYPDDPTEVTINGNKFWTIGLIQTTDGATQRVAQYVIMQGTVLLQFLFVSPDEKGLRDMDPSIQSLQVKTINEKPSPTRTARKKKAPAPAQ